MNMVTNIIPLSNAEMEQIVGGFSGEVTNELTKCIGKEVYMVHECTNGVKNFVKVRIQSAKGNLVEFSCTANQDDQMETNMNLYSFLERKAWRYNDGSFNVYDVGKVKFFTDIG